MKGKIKKLIQERCHIISDIDNTITFSYGMNKFQIKFDDDKINYLLKNYLTLETKVQWSNTNEYLGQTDNSILPQNFDYSVEHFIDLIS